MNLHREELRLAGAYDEQRAFDALTQEQTHLLMERGRALFKWYKAHLVTHNLINAGVLAVLFAADAWVLLGLPRLMLTPGGETDTLRIAAAAAITGSLHSWLMYSLVIFGIHEGAAHDSIFVGSGFRGRIGRFIGRHVCRLAAAEPEEYAACHMAHHARFGTEHDAEFLNFVMPRRYWLTFLPLASLVNFSDFLAHRPLSYTRNRLISGLAALAYQGTYAYVLYRSFGGLFVLLAMAVFFPHVGFFVDRVRQFTEHNLMPLDNRNGARSFGIGFWGLLVGGGPWGQPCHLVHHIVPSVPWYQQILLHRYMKTLLSERQRQQFLVTPVIGYPRLLWRIIRTANAFAREQRMMRTGS